MKKKSSESRGRYVISPAYHTPAMRARMKVSRENRQEYDNEKRAKELIARMPDGHIDARAVAVAKMMSIDEHKAKKLIKARSKGLVLDGKIN